MNTHDLQYEKINLIKWITQLQDEAIIAKLKKIQAKEDSVEFPSMTVQEMIEQAETTEKEIEKGETTSHDDFYQEFKKW